MNRENNLAENDFNDKMNYNDKTTDILAVCEKQHRYPRCRYLTDAKRLQSQDDQSRSSISSGRLDGAKTMR